MHERPGARATPKKGLAKPGGDKDNAACLSRIRRALPDAGDLGDGEATRSAPVSPDRQSMHSAALSQCGSLRSKKATPDRELYFEKAENWKSEITTKDILEGVALGREVWGAAQTLTALQRTHASDGATVLFKASVDLWVLAVDRRGGH